MGRIGRRAGPRPEAPRGRRHLDLGLPEDGDRGRRVQILVGHRLGSLHRRHRHREERRRPPDSVGIGGLRALFDGRRRRGRRGWRRRRLRCGRRLGRRGGALFGRLLHEVADERGEPLRVEGLRDAGVGSRALGPRLVEGLEGPGEKDDGHVPAARPALDLLAQLVAGLSRHDAVREDDVRREGVEERKRQIAVSDGLQLELRSRERQLDDLLNGQTVVCQENPMRHSISSQGPVSA